MHSAPSAHHTIQWFCYFCLYTLIMPTGPTISSQYPSGPRRYAYRSSDTSGLLAHALTQRRGFLTYGWHLASPGRKRATYSRPRARMSPLVTRSYSSRAVD